MLKLTEKENEIFINLKNEASQAAKIHNAGNAPNQLINLQIMSRLQNRIELLENEIHYLKKIIEDK